MLDRALWQPTQYRPTRAFASSGDATGSGTAAGAFWGLIAGMAVVLTVAFTTPIAFLWHNLIGAVTVVLVGMTISVLAPAPRVDGART